MNWTDRVAIVTGASSGIGLAVAKEFCARGVKVALVARSAGKLESLARELGVEKAAAFPLDVTDRAGLLALPASVKARFGRLDFLINNAGLNNRGPVRERTAEELVAILDTNLIAPILLTQAALPLFEKHAVVVNIASLAGKVPVPHEATYSGSKAGLRAFARALDLESQLHGDHVRVCTVNPGPVSTGFFGADLSKVPDLVFSQPMSEAEDIVRAVVRCIETGEQELDVPKLSGKLATLAYLSPKLFTALRPTMEKRGARNKKRYLEKQGK